MTTKRSLRSQIEALESGGVEPSSLSLAALERRRNNSYFDMVRAEDSEAERSAWKAYLAAGRELERRQQATLSGGNP